MHESEPGRSAWSDVAAWRRAERTTQLERRQSLSSQLQREYSGSIAKHALEAIGDVSGLTVSLYWPIRREPDLRNLLAEITRRGGRCALPVVVRKGQPLEFHLWQAGDRLTRGIWNIPVPAEGVSVAPDVTIAPVVAFDGHCYRLGYGGGYFDRTLSAMPIKPRVLGIGYAMAKIATIFPQPHDIPMDAIVTESGVLHLAEGL